MITLNTRLGPVDVREAFEGYEAGVELQRGPYVQKCYIVPSYAVAFACVDALMGAGPTPIRHACPESPNLRCLDAALQPRAPYDARDSGRPTFGLPIIRATYQIPTWAELPTDDPQADNSFPNEIDPGTPYVYMEQSIDFGTEVAKIPGRAYTFGDGTPSDTPAVRPIGVATFTLVRRWQQLLPYANVTAYLNRLNVATFLGQPRGQILFRGARTRRQFTSDGTTTQEVELQFRWREADWNKVFRPDTGQFDALVQANFIGPAGPGGPPSMLKYADLTQLLM